MKTLSLLPLLAFASPALAHGGAHLHPHAANSWLPVVLGLAVILGAATLAYIQRNRP
ncbi:hypothetical protein [Parasedimentitalea marina]|uniref:hypothetical protein n=1 Tax=Parasedimentitalea marina TaxID=2483033 RepID=UPI0013E2CFAE|nr:hypothetical protein [Parasedimentitalea marina]